MSRREEKIDKADESAGIAQALAELIEKNRAQAVDLAALARLVEAEIEAGQQREAEDAARLREALRELAAAKAAVEIERQARIEAEERADGLALAVDGIREALARVPPTRSPVSLENVPKPDRCGQVADGKGEAASPAVAPDETAPANPPSDYVVEHDEQRAAASDVKPRNVSVVVNLASAEAAALAALAARRGSGDDIAAVATRLIHDGLLRSGWRPTADEKRPRQE